MTDVTSLEPGENDETWDAGVYATVGSLGDYVWLDVNQNGMQDIGEPGIENIEVRLYNSTNNLIDTDLTDFGKLLHENWMIKRKLTDKISNSTIDDIYERGLKAGALGGKILGAGGGGFMLFFVEPEMQSRVKRELKDLLHVPFRFDNVGSQIIYYTGENNY